MVNTCRKIGRYASCYGDKRSSIIDNNDNNHRAQELQTELLTELDIAT